MTGYQQTFGFIAAGTVLPLIFLPMVDPLHVDPYKYGTVDNGEAGRAGDAPA